MAISDFYRRTLYLEQDPVADKFYERTVGLVFEKENEKARVEVRCWSDLDLEPYRTRDNQLPSESSLELNKDAARPIPQTSRSARLAVIDLDLKQLRRFTQVRPLL
jgi:hypothetical protein